MGEALPGLLQADKNASKARVFLIADWVKKSCA